MQWSESGDPLALRDLAHMQELLESDECLQDLRRRMGWPHCGHGGDGPALPMFLILAS
jgi:hypothetical protein